MQRLREGDSLAVWPWMSLARPTTAAARVRRAAVLARRTRAEDELGPWGVRVAAWGWLVVQPLLVARVWWRGGEPRAPAPRLRDLFNLWWASWRHNVAPGAYYRHRLYETAHLGLAAACLSSPELYELLRVLNAGLAWGPLDDKWQFFNRCGELGLPTPFVSGLFRRGERVAWNEPSGWPARDLIVKPANLMEGLGVERWNAVDGGWAREGQRLDAARFDAHVRQVSRLQGEILVQHALQNHQGLADLGHRGLCTARVITVRGRNSAARVVAASLRIPRGESAVDNVAAGGLSAPIDLETGCLGLAELYDPRNGRFWRHPDRDCAIEGRIVPHWAAVQSLACRAHSAFAEFPTIGWDVAVTPAGPSLVEANSIFSAPSRPPLLTTGLVDVLDERLEDGLKGTPLS